MHAVTVLDGHVAHERLDDEVVVINLETGAYYALDGPAADCWTLLSAGTSIDRTVDTLAERHGADPNVVRADVDALAAELVAEGLVVVGPGSLDAVELPATITNGASTTYKTLRIQKYDDMEELLLLDPVHEVDEAGWPALPAEST